MVRDVFSNTFTMGRLFRCFSSRNEPCGGADATVGGGETAMYIAGANGFEWVGFLGRRQPASSPQYMGSWRRGSVVRTSVSG